MKKRMYFMLPLVIIWAVCFFLTGCDLQIVNVVSKGGDFEVLNISMNTNETYFVNRSHFNDWDIQFDKFELHTQNNQNVVKIKNNHITAVNSGYTIVSVTFYRKGISSGKKVMFAKSMPFAIINVINEDTLISITTAEQLDNIRHNLNGNYILKADIDLNEWGNWTPIGSIFSVDNFYHYEPFTGMLINPDGYKIKNLKIATIETQAGLFGVVAEKAIISGIVLEDIFIDVSDYISNDYHKDSDVLNGAGSPKVGGIAAITSREVLIQNCSVSGVLIGGGYSTGGIVGTNQNSFILGCNFTGKIDGPSIKIYPASIGGIAGTHYAIDYYGIFWVGYIKNCIANADINGFDIAESGGIIGYNGLDMGISNCSFVGTITGRTVGKIIGFNANSHSPIN